MATDVWSSPVELRLEDGDHSRCIRNSREALAYLKTGWPAAHDATYAHAVRECLSALNHRCGCKRQASKPMSDHQLSVRTYCE